MRLLPLRTVGIIGLLWAAVAVILFVTARSTASFIAAATTTQVDTDLKLWDTVHELTDDSLINSVADYTFWDDMAEFAEGKRDAEWGRENLDPGLDSFGIDALWVLNSDGALVYSVMQDRGRGTVPPPLPFTLDQIRQLVATPDEEYGAMHEFYLFSDIGPLTIAASGITSTNDPEHKLPPRGYYFAARLLTEESALSHITDIDASAAVEARTDLPPPIAPTDVQPHVFWHRMWDITGTTIGAIRIERSVPTFVELVKNSRDGLHLTMTLWVLMGIVTTGLVLALSRTQQRAAALADQMTSQLREVNILLEKRVAERTADLEADIRQRMETEDRLRKRTEELERLNKVMVDRELRVVELKQKLKERENPEQPV